jgi:hypothetical protein|tara:strand:+ start:174 stop:443 length:270 start_codon:yes stop_codon:yes gene_type:complete
MVTESKDYELIPLEDDTESWGVRILTGEFSETVIKYGNVGFEGEGNDMMMKFNFDIISTPDEDLEVETNTELQELARDILITIFEEDKK